MKLATSLAGKRFLVFLAVSALVIAALVAGSGEESSAAGVWTNTTGSLTVGRFSFRAVTLQDGRVIAIGGSIAGEQHLDTSEIYNPASGTWSAGPTMHAARREHTATLLNNGKVLVAGGYPGCTASDLFDPATNTFSITTGQLVACHTRHGAALLNDGKVLVAGGYQGCMVTTSETFNPATNTWSLTTGAMQKARADFNLVKLQDGRVLAAGGDDDCAFPRKTNRAEIFNPATGLWTEVAPMNFPRAHYASVLLADGRVLVVSGDNDSTTTTTAEIYNPTANQWTQVAGIHKARFFPLGDGAFLLSGGKVLVAGSDGSASDPVSTSEIYDPVANTWTQPVPLNAAHCGPATARLSNGRPFVISGSNCAGPFPARTTVSEYYLDAPNMCPGPATGEGFDFTAPCQQRDVCYVTAASNPATRNETARGACDSAFYGAMVASCSSVAPAHYFGCLTRAFNYYTFAVLFGWVPFYSIPVQ